MKTKRNILKLVMIMVLLIGASGVWAQSTVDPDHACFNSNQNYYVTATAGSTYDWVLSGGGSITSGTGTNSIFVDWTIVGSYTLTVTETTSLGCVGIPVILNIIVDPLPVITIIGSSPVCVNSSGNIYTTEAGMSNYIWVVSAGGLVTSGGTATDNTVTITWNTSGPQSVSVNYTNGNGCVAATPLVLNVTVDPLPVTSPIYHF